jgi:type II secretory pathway pseudopilin PulG
MKFSGPVWRRKPSGAYTLIELLAVVGVILLLVGGIGFALGDAGATSLANAQNTLASLAGTARAQAAVRQTEARLLIYALRPPNGDIEKYLRYLRVVVAATPGSTGPGSTWLAVGPAVSLPRGIYVVPTATVGLVASGVTWPANPAPVSTLMAATRYTVTGDPATTATDTYFALEFAPNGTVTPTAAKLAVSTATVSNNLPAFNNSGAVRGVLFRTSGSVTLINEVNSF